MARSAGARNADYDARRSALIHKARERLAARGAGQPSFRQLADAAGVSVTTMRHYFGSRESVVDAIFAHSYAGATMHLARARVPDNQDLSLSLQSFLQSIVRGWTQGGVDTLHRIGLAEGLRDDQAGLQYLNKVLEPTLQALEQRLGAHIAAGSMRAADTRHAALLLLAPVVLGLLHQHDLGGTRCRPLDLGEVIAAQVEVFVRAYQV
ncbi:MAG TPA: TetR/AcrR family transcriptional regulator [Steroidobacteraceae bacterium]|nr:TetR/AcrR family transcriptional regulator [Steroidobacteraceae bacterium]HRX88949.1 TetR/AcrR family transcriptional regulator [Steroidobacteraceae bacterium]